jgi:prevent-host-death family protein
MHKISLSEAGSRLAELVEEATGGEEVIITNDNGPSVQLVPITLSPPQPQFGSARGRVKIADNFDAPLEDFADYAP